jgi:hypothetical protein
MGLPLVTRAEYKAYAGLTSTNSDTIIDSLIPKVSALVKTICRRTFVDYVSDYKTEIFNGGCSFFALEESPIITIVSVEYSSNYGVTYTTLVEYTDYIYDSYEKVIRPVLTSEFPRLVNGYKINYTAGFSNIPEELKLAVMDLITYYIKNDAVIHSNKTPSTNSVQIEYVTTTNLPAHIKRVLDQYAANYN